MQNHWQKLTLSLRVPGAPLADKVCERAQKRAFLRRKDALFDWTWAEQLPDAERRSEAGSARGAARSGLPGRLPNGQASGDWRSAMLAGRTAVAALNCPCRGNSWRPFCAGRGPAPGHRARSRGNLP